MRKDIERKAKGNKSANDSQLSANDIVEMLTSDDDEEHNSNTQRPPAEDNPLPGANEVETNNGLLHGEEVILLMRSA